MQKIKLISFCLITFSLLLSGLSPAQAEEIQVPCGLGASYKVVMPAGIALEGSKCSGALVIDPSVRVIGNNAFSFSKITSVKLSDSVTLIEAGGLSYLNLESIDLGNSVQSFGFEAFRGTRVSSLILPKSLRIIGESALSDTNFKTIEIPNSVTSIERTAFAREDSRAVLDSITIPDSVKSIGFAAFVRAGIRSLKIGKGIWNIPASAFEGNQIQELIIPDSVKEIHAYAFRGNPISKITFGNSVQIIDSEAFARTKIVSLQLPQSLTGIGEKAFSNITTLIDVDFPDDFNPMFNSNNEPTVGDIFEGSYAVSRIFYCGKATGFYVAPTCEGSRKMAYDAKVAAESKTAEEEAANRDAARAAFDKEQQIAIQQAIADAAISSKPILLKISSENPICPTGFIQLQTPKQSKTSYGPLILCQSIVKSPEERAAAEKAAAEKAAAEKAAAEKAAISALSIKVKSVVKKITIACLKGKTILKVTNINPKCPTGYKKK